MVTYRTDGDWGSGKGVNLTAGEVDENFYGLDQRVTDLEENPPEGKYVAYLEVRTGNKLYAIMSDLTEVGPITLPIAQWSFRQQWTAYYQYYPLDVFRTDAGIYLVRYAHISAATFDPDANDGNGNDYYTLVLPRQDAATFRGEWEAITDYVALDLVTVTTPLAYSGVYQVNIGHLSAGEFDPDETYPASGGDPIYTKLFDFPTKRVEIAPYFFLPHPDGAVMYEFIASRGFTLKAGLSESHAKATSAPSGSAVWTLTFNGYDIGTVEFASDTAGVFTFPHDVEFVAGDVLGFVAPDPAVGGLGNVAMNIVGILS